MPRISGTPSLPRAAVVEPAPGRQPPATAGDPARRGAVDVFEGSKAVSSADDVTLPAGLRDLFPAGQKGRAVWVWDEAAGTLPAPARLVDACRQMGVSQLYVNAYPATGKHLEQLEQIVALAAHEGIQTQLLCGAPDWTDPGVRPWIASQVLEPLQAMLARVRAQNPGLQVEGALHLDVQPQAGGMTADKAEAYVQMLAWFQGELGGKLALAADVPGWFADPAWTAAGKPLGEAILDQVDQLTLMAYSRDPGRIAGIAEPLVAAASALGKKVVVGVETRPSTENVHLASQQLAGEALSLVDQAFAGKDAASGYAGLAVHDFASLLALPP